jgi:hypothetical protein
MFVVGKTVLLSLICLFALLSAGPALAYQDASIVRATRVDGTVLKNGSPLKEGDVIDRDDRIEAQAKSAAVLSWSNGSLLELYPETALVLQGVVFESDRKMEKSLLVLEKGRVFVKAQVPEHLFSHFEMSAGGVTAMSQGAEFAWKYDAAGKTSTLWSLLGTLVVNLDTQKVRVEDGQQVVLKAGAKAETPAPMSEKLKAGLTQASKRLGGSLLVEETLSAGGPLRIKIGGVRNRRGNSPLKLKFKALVGGGSGNLKSIDWSFGDGESATGKEAQHAFTQGVYVIVLRVEDENGDRATAQLNISVEDDCGC